MRNLNARNVPGPRVQRAAGGVRVEVRREGDAGGEAAVLAVLPPPDVVGGRDGADVVVGGELAVLGLPAGGIVLQGMMSGNCGQVKGVAGEERGAYGDLRIVRLGRAARGQAAAVGEVDDLGVALLERERVLGGGDGHGGGSGESQEEGEGAEGLHGGGGVAGCWSEDGGAVDPDGGEAD